MLRGNAPFCCHLPTDRASEDALSKTHVRAPAAGRTSWAGRAPGKDCTSKALCTTPALPSPSATKKTCCALRPLPHMSGLYLWQRGKAIGRSGARALQRHHIDRDTNGRGELSGTFSKKTTASKANAHRLSMPTNQSVSCAVVVPNATNRAGTRHHPLLLEGVAQSAQASFSAPAPVTLWLSLQHQSVADPAQKCPESSAFLTLALQETQLGSFLSAWTAPEQHRVLKRV